MGVMMFISNEAFSNTISVRNFCRAFGLVSCALFMLTACGGGKSYGAKDADGDGVDNATDAFINDAAETEDSDGDGVGDNSDAFPSNPMRINPIKTATVRVMLAIRRFH